MPNTSKDLPFTRVKLPTPARRRSDTFAKRRPRRAKPFIYLSAGVSNAQFTESLKMASEADTAYSGVLCGRATWKEGVPVYAKQGVKALEDWLQREGVKNITAVNNAIQSAKPWYAKMGLAAQP